MDSAIAYENIELNITNMSAKSRDTLRRAVKAVNLLQIEATSPLLNRIGCMCDRVDCWPDADGKREFYRHFDTCVNRDKNVVSLMQPYDYIVDNIDVHKELSYIAAGISLYDGPMRGFIGLLDYDYSWHYPDSSVLIVHTESPTFRPDAFRDLLYYHFDSAEAAWWYLSSEGKKCRDRIIYFDEAENRGCGQWWMELYKREFANYPWVVGGINKAFIFSSDTAFDTYGYKCR